MTGVLHPGHTRITVSHGISLETQTVLATGTFPPYGPWGETVPPYGSAAYRGHWKQMAPCCTNAVIHQHPLTTAPPTNSALIQQRPHTAVRATGSTGNRQHWQCHTPVFNQGASQSHDQPPASGGLPLPTKHSIIQPVRGHTDTTSAQQGRRQGKSAKASPSQEGRLVDMRHGRNKLPPHRDNNSSGK